MKRIYVFTVIIAMTICMISCGKSKQNQETVGNSIGTETIISTETVLEEVEVEFNESTEIENVTDTNVSDSEKIEADTIFVVESEESEIIDYIEEVPQTPATPPVYIPVTPSTEEPEKTTELPNEVPTEIPVSTEKNMDAPIELPFVPAP